MPTMLSEDERLANTHSLRRYAILNKNYEPIYQVWTRARTRSDIVQDLGWALICAGACKAQILETRNGVPMRGTNHLGGIAIWADDTETKFVAVRQKNLSEKDT